MKSAIVDICTRIKLLPVVTITTTVHRMFGLAPKTPIEIVFKRLRKQNLLPGEELHALEVFGGKGDWVAKFYYKNVSTLDVWEIAPEYENTLRQNLPKAEVKITDSYQEIKTTSKKYNLIVVDSPFALHGQHCEHFDLFPDIFRIAMDSAILILQVHTRVSDTALRQYPYLFSEEHLARRASFYKTGHPERLSFDELVSRYRDIAVSNGFFVDWHFFQERRWSTFYFLVLGIRKLEPSHMVVGRV